MSDNTRTTFYGVTIVVSAKNAKEAYRQVSELMRIGTEKYGIKQWYSDTYTEQSDIDDEPEEKPTMPLYLSEPHTVSEPTTFQEAIEDIGGGVSDVFDVDVAELDDDGNLKE